MNFSKFILSISSGLLVLSPLLPVSPPLHAMPAPLKTLRIVLDPGHGGADEGAVFIQNGQRITEKQVALSLALETAEQLRRQAMEVVLTRTSDLEVPLSVRTTLANRLNADVFLSIHLNSIPNSETHDAEGIETYILNTTTDASSRRLAQLENTMLHKDPQKDPNNDTLSSDIALILKDLRLDANLTESKELACAIQTHLAAQSWPPLKRETNRGVKQALFHVLLGADMPSALLEAGFLSNTNDRQRVLSLTGRRKMAISIAQGIVRYYEIRRNPSIPKTPPELSNCKIN